MLAFGDFPLLLFQFDVGPLLFRWNYVKMLVSNNAPAVFQVNMANLIILSVKNETDDIIHS